MTYALFFLFATLIVDCLLFLPCSIPESIITLKGHCFVSFVPLLQFISWSGVELILSRVLVEGTHLLAPSAHMVLSSQFLSSLSSQHTTHPLLPLLLLSFHSMQSNFGREDSGAGTWAELKGSASKSATSLFRVA